MGIDFIEQLARRAIPQIISVVSCQLRQQCAQQLSTTLFGSVHSHHQIFIFGLLENN